MLPLLLLLLLLRTDFSILLFSLEWQHFLENDLLTDLLDSHVSGLFETKYLVFTFLMFEEYFLVGLFLKLLYLVSLILLAYLCGVEAISSF